MRMGEPDIDAPHRVHGYVKQCDGWLKCSTHMTKPPPFPLVPRRTSLSLETPHIKSHVHGTLVLSRLFRRARDSMNTSTPLLMYS